MTNFSAPDLAKAFGTAQDAEPDLIVTPANALGTGSLQVDLCPGNYHMIATFPQELYDATTLPSEDVVNAGQASSYFDFDGNSFTYQTYTRSPSFSITVGKLYTVEIVSGEETWETAIALPLPVEDRGTPTRPKPKLYPTAGTVLGLATEHALPSWDIVGTIQGEFADRNEIIPETMLAEQAIARAKGFGEISKFLPVTICSPTLSA